MLALGTAAQIPLKETSHSELDEPSVDQLIESTQPPSEMQHASDASELGEGHSADIVFQELEDSGLAVANPIARIRERLDDPSPLTWLFTGTDYGFDATRAKRSCVEFFSDFIKYRADRRLDVIVDSTYAEHSLRGLKENASWRVARFLPDVVFVLLDLTDLYTTPVETFGQSLYDFIVELQEEHCTVVLCTPAALQSDGDPDIESHLEQIRRVADENEVGLIDNFKYWTESVDFASLGKLLNNERLTTAGHQKLARTILRNLGLLKS
jgi:hypothetical protein